MEGNIDHGNTYVNKKMYASRKPGQINGKNIYKTFR